MNDQCDFTILEVAQEILNQVPNINYGGCGLSALALVRCLRKNGIEAEAKYSILYRTPWDAQHNQEYIDNNETPREFPHVVVEIDGAMYDSTGEIDSSYWGGFAYIPERLLVETLNIDDWNSRFDRKRWHGHIEAELGIDLSDVAVSFDYDGSPIFRKDLEASCTA